MTRNLRSKASAVMQAATVPSGSHPERRISSERAVLILDARGAVQFCSDAAAQLFDGRSEEMLGRPIRSLIPALPLRIVTPGYNVAYARFCEVQQAWCRFGRPMADGQTRPMELRLKAAQRHQDVPYALIVSLRGGPE